MHPCYQFPLFSHRSAQKLHASTISLNIPLSLPSVLALLGVWYLGGGGGLLFPTAQCTKLCRPFLCLVWTTSLMFQPCLTFYTWWSTPSAFIDATLTFPCNYPAQRKRSFYNPPLVHVGSSAGKFPIFLKAFNFCLWDVYFFHILVAVTVEYKVQLAIHKYLNWFSFEKAGFWHQELNHSLVYCLCCSGVSFVARIITWLSVSAVIQKWIVEKLLEKPDVSVKRVRYPALWNCNSGLVY